MEGTNDKSGTVPILFRFEWAGDVNMSSTHTPSDVTESAEAEDYARTPVNELRHQTGNSVGIHTWADYHDVCAWLLPFRHRESDPIELGQQINAKLAELPETASTITRPDLGVASHPECILKPLFTAHKITVLKNTNDKKRYRNPRYSLYDEWLTPITDTEARIEFYNRYISLGTASVEWIAKHFGISTERLYQFSTEHLDGVSPDKQRQQNTTRLGKTAATAVAWGACSKAEFARAVGIPQSTLHGYLKRATNSGWKPPACPDDKSWFEPSVSG